MCTIFEISKPWEIYTFWKIDFSKNISSFLVDLFWEPQGGFLANWSLRPGGAHSPLIHNVSLSLTPFKSHFEFRNSENQRRVSSFHLLPLACLTSWPQNGDLIPPLHSSLFKLQLGGSWCRNPAVFHLLPNYFFFAWTLLGESSSLSLSLSSYGS